MRVATTFPDAEIAEDAAHVLRTDPNRPHDHDVTCSVEDGKVTLTGDVRYAQDAPIMVATVRGVTA